jgi:hypothetical protein
VCARETRTLDAVEEFEKCNPDIRVRARNAELAGSVYWVDSDFWPIDTVYFVEPDSVSLFGYHNTLTVSVTAANTGGSRPPVTSAPTGAVINIIPANSTVPTISGTAQVGQTFTATTGTWTQNPTSFTYQWNRAGTAISGATRSSYVPVTADIGNTLTVSRRRREHGRLQPARDVALGVHNGEA